MEQAKDMGLKRLIFFVCLILIAITFVVSQPPTQSTEILDKGIQVEVPIIETIKANESYKIHIHAFNLTDGRILDNSSTWCMLHIYNPQGSHQFEGNLSFDSNLVDFDKNILGGNFSQVGQYAAVIWCESDGEVGGFLEYGFDVTPSGLMLTEGESLIYFVVLLLMLAIFCFSLYGAVFIPFRNTVSESDASVINVNTLKYLKVFLIVLCYILLFFMTSIIYSVSNSFLLIDKLSFVFYYLWVILYAGIWPCIVLSVLLMLIKFLQDSKIKNALERGVPFRT